MRLTEFLQPELVLPDLQTEGLASTLQAFATHLEETGRIQDGSAVVAALEEREASHSTSLGNGVALPHATVAGLERPVVLVARAPRGVSFGSTGGDPIRLFFVLLSPADQAGAHIKLLARIVRLVRRPDFIPSVLDAGNADAIVAAVGRLDAIHS